jgi:hypothetical protein
MDRTIDTAITFRLAPADLTFGVDVRLRRAGERWVAIAGIAGREQTGVGASPRGALNASLATLDARSIRALLADTALLDPSCVIAAALSAG